MNASESCVNVTDISLGMRNHCYVASPTRLLWALHTPTDLHSKPSYILSILKYIHDLPLCSQKQLNAIGRIRRAWRVENSLRLKATALLAESRHPQIEIRGVVRSFYRQFLNQQVEFFISRGGGFILGDHRGEAVY